MTRVMTASKKLIMMGTRSTLSLSSSNFDMTEIIQNLKDGQVENTGKEFRVLLKYPYYAKVVYEQKKQMYDLQHAEIPTEFQGKGLGSIFAKKIFDHLIAEDELVKLKLTCEYLQHFYQKNQNKYENYIEH